MLNDDFGMAGMLTFLRTIERVPSIVGLALGHDLTNLGLNLNSSKKNLYQTFGGPWADFPCRIQDLDAKVPEEYLTNATIRDKLPNIKLNKLHEDVLFYLFYNCPGEVYQVAAASELFARDWRFHKIERLWLQRSPAPYQIHPREIVGTYERCSYVVFDPIQWRRVPREMVLEYKDLEGKPTVPGAGRPSSSINAGGAFLRPSRSREGTVNNPPTDEVGSGLLSSSRKFANSEFSNISKTYVAEQLEKISHGITLPRSDMKILFNFLEENPEIFSLNGMCNRFLSFMQYEPEVAGILLTFQHMYDSVGYAANLEILLNTELNVQMLMAVNKFVQLSECKSFEVSNDFLNRFISLCISTIERLDSAQDLAVHRLARMVCVFFNSLLNLKNFDPSVMRSQIQNFATSCLAFKEASLLYQRMLQN